MKRGLSLAGVTLIAIVAVRDSRAEPGPPSPANAALAVYVETIPTGRGSRAVGEEELPRTPLPPAVRSDLVREGGEDAELLEEVATSASYGAPQQPSSARGKARTRATPPPGAPRSSPKSRPDIPEAEVPSLDASGTARWWALLAGMALSAAAAGSAARKRPNPARS